MENKCRVCSERDEMINHIIIEYSKLAQKNTRLDMTGWRRNYARIEIEIWSY